MIFTDEAFTEAALDSSKKTTHGLKIVEGHPYKGQSMLEVHLTFKKGSEMVVPRDNGSLGSWSGLVQLRAARLEPVLSWACTKQCPDYSQNYSETINTTPFTAFLVLFSPKRKKKISKYYINAQNC